MSEKVNMKTVTWSNEGLSEAFLGLVDTAVGEFRKKNPYIANMYIKSENAFSYRRNFEAFKFSVKSVNPTVQSLCVMIKMSPIHYQVLFYCFVASY